jgi:hypothetical protein
MLTPETEKKGGKRMNFKDILVTYGDKDEIEPETFR